MPDDTQNQPLTRAEFDTAMAEFRAAVERTVAAFEQRVLFLETRRSA